MKNIVRKTKLICISILMIVMNLNIISAASANIIRPYTFGFGSATDGSEGTNALIAEGKLENLTFTDSTGHQITYWAHIPKDDSNKPIENLPVVLFMHGYSDGGAGTRTAIQYHNGVLYQLIKDQNKPERQSIILIPQTPSSQNGAGEQDYFKDQWVGIKGNDKWSQWNRKSWDMDQTPRTENLNSVVELLKDVQGKTKADTDRAYVTGLSMGGYATWDLISRNANEQLFAAAAPICGVGDLSKLENIKNLPIRTFHGTQDSTIGVDSTRNMYQGLRKYGNIAYTEYPDENHPSWNAAYSNAVDDDGNGVSNVEDLLAWMFNQSKNGTLDATVDKTPLKGILKDAKALDEKKYSEETWKTLQSQIQLGEDLLKDKTATKEAVDEVIANLDASMNDVIAFANLALNQPATASNVEAGAGAGNAVDGNQNTKWGTDQNKAVNEWIEVDFESTKEFNTFKIDFERTDAKQNILGYKIEVFNGTSYESVYTKSERAKQSERITLPTSVQGSKVKLTITAADGGTLDYVNVGIKELEVYNTQNEKDVNHMLDATMRASSVEVPSLSADKANDGNRTTRWSSEEVNPENQWIQAMFDKPTFLKQINLSFLTRTGSPINSNIEQFSIKYTDTYGEEQYIIENYKNESLGTGKGFKTELQIELPMAIIAKDITICDFVANAATYNNIGIQEIEGYSNVVKDFYTITPVAQGSGTVSEAQRIAKGAEVRINAKADEGHTFVGWYLNGNKVSDQESYTFVVQEDATLVAKFIPADVETPMDKNLALNKPVTGSADYSTLPFRHATDGNATTRWSSELAPTQYIVVDLGKNETFNKFTMQWESASVNAKAYNLYVSDDNATWNKVYSFQNDNGAGATSTVNIGDEVFGRYVKLEVTGMFGYQNVSLREFEVYRTAYVQDPNVNIALHAKASATDTEVESLNPSNAVDGDRGTRWAAAPNVNLPPKYFQIDLGKEKDIRTVKLFWERRNVTKYRIQVANEEGGPWVDVYTKTTFPEDKEEKIVLDKTHKARYVRVQVDSYLSTDPVTPEATGNPWSSFSLYEVELYGGEIKDTASDVARKIKIENPLPGERKLNIDHILDSVPEGFQITYNGTDYEHVIDTDLTIYEPVVDTSVAVSFKVVDNETKEYSFQECNIVVPGRLDKEDSINEKPVVAPALMEWFGTTGEFTLRDTSKIIVKDEALLEMANTFAQDYLEMSGKTLAVSKNGSAKAGDIVFTLVDAETGLKKEGYEIEIADIMNIKAEDKTGAFWSTRSILQILKQNANTTIPMGVTRDYPKYEVRSFILDVGRKTFTFDFLQQLSDQMSWYKMNDFQVHLNDNFIFLEKYTQQGLDPMDAYSGFRLESDIKKGGNGGLNKTDLTSTDMFYSKDEFREFIQDSRKHGVNIVPEIDVPAHSLQLTKVRPDLRYGTNGRENDYLNLLGNKYDESIGFVKDIFNEYMSGENPVFDKDTIVHVGADEYPGDKEAYRKFTDEMLKFVQDSGRDVRVWGSLTSMNGKTPVRSKDVQMNMWNNGWAAFDQMYEEGYDLVNSKDGGQYMVPGAGYYGDYLNASHFYTGWEPNTIASTTIPAGDAQMKGAAFALWNDGIDMYANGLSEYDMYDRIQYAMPAFAAKLWGNTSDMKYADFDNKVKEIGNAPGVNLSYEVESKTDLVLSYGMDDQKDLSGNGYGMLNLSNAELTNIDQRSVVSLLTPKSYVETPIEQVGEGYTLRVKVKRTSDSNDEQILFESDKGSIKAVQKDTGKVGFSREGYDYSFNYTLPKDEWVELGFVTNKENYGKNGISYKMTSSLYVNGKKVDTLGDDETIAMTQNGEPGYMVPMHATLLFPIQRIGSKTKSFIGYVDDVLVVRGDAQTSTNALASKLAQVSTVREEDIDATSFAPFKLALDQANSIYRKVDATQEQIDAAILNLATAYDNLVYVATPEELRTTIEKAKAVDVSLRTTASVEALQKEITAGENLLKVEHPSAKQLLDAMTAIEKAITNLAYKDADYTKLDVLLAKVPSDLSLYTQSSVKNLQEVLNRIEKGLDITMQNKVNGYVTDLQKALDSLTKIEIDEEVSDVLIKNENDSVQVFGKLPNGASISVVEKAKDDALIQLALKNNTEYFKHMNIVDIFDIHVMMGDAIYEIKEPVQVSIAIPEHLKGKQAKVIYIGKDGTIQDMNAKIENGYYVFTTTHFSYFAIVAETTVPPVSPTPTPTPTPTPVPDTSDDSEEKEDVDTGDTNSIAFFTCSFLFAAGFLVVLRKKRKE